MKRAWLVVAAAAVGACAALLSTAGLSLAQGAGQRQLKWERLDVVLELPPTMAPMAESQRQALLERLACYRTKVPGGWLVMTPRGGIAHVPDAEHGWDGNSLR